MNHNSNGMYNVLNIFKKLEPTQEQTVKAEAKKIYESVEAQGSILAGIDKVEKRLSEAYAATKEGKYGDDGIDYSGKFGDRKAEKPPVNTKFDSSALSSMFGKAPKKHFGTVSAKNQLALPGEDDEFSDTDPASLDSALKHIPRNVREGEREGNPTIPGTDNKAKSRYNPTNKPAPVQKLKEPTDKFDKMKESAEGERPYVCVHAKKGKCEVTAKSSYEAAQKAAAKWRLKSTAGIDSYLADVKHTAVNEGVNFTEMMKKQHMTLEEMLKTLSDDIAEFKRTGHVSEPLRDCMSVYEYGKTQLSDDRHVPRGSSFASQMPSGEDILPTPSQEPSMLGKIGGAMKTGASAVGKAIVGKNDDELLADLENQVGGHNRYNEEEELNELARLAGLSVNESVQECDMGAMASEMESNEGKINVSTNMSSDGNKSVSINADGNAAEQLMQILSMAGLGGGDAHAKLSSEQPVDVIAVDSGSGDEEVDEAVGATAQYANTPEEEYQGQDVIAHQGADMNREKKQFADKPKAGDNPMATSESVDPVAAFGRDLMAEYQALKLQK